MTAVAYTLGALCAVWLLAAALIVLRAVRTRVPAACGDDAWADEACALTQNDWASFTAHTQDDYDRWKADHS